MGPAGFGSLPEAVGGAVGRQDSGRGYVPVGDVLHYRRRRAAAARRLHLRRRGLNPTFHPFPPSSATGANVLVRIDGGLSHRIIHEGKVFCDLVYLWGCHVTAFFR